MFACYLKVEPSFGAGFHPVEWQKLIRIWSTCIVQDDPPRGATEKSAGAIEKNAGAIEKSGGAMEKNAGNNEKSVGAIEKSASAIEKNEGAIEKRGSVISTEMVPGSETVTPVPKRYCSKAHFKVKYQIMISVQISRTIYF
jgi:hypothetical protein